MIAIFECQGDKTHGIEDEEMIAGNRRGTDARTLTTRGSARPKAEFVNREITGSRTGAIEDADSATVYHKMLEFKFRTSSYGHFVPLLFVSRCEMEFVNCQPDKILY